ncbi:MAG: T9SS type A sorting domain-containing protein [candidate division WOR-3 bacterium]
MKRGKVVGLMLFCYLFVFSLFGIELIKDDFRLNDDEVGGNNYSPDVLIFGNGEEVIFWGDERNGSRNIYGQFYDSLGNKLWGNFKLTMMNAFNWETDPKVSNIGDSLLVIYKYGYAQWLTIEGEALGYPIYLGYLYDFDFAISDSGIFLVGSTYISGKGYDVFLKRFKFNGDSVGQRIILNTDGSSADQMYPFIARDNNGRFVVVWRDCRNSSKGDIYGQLINEKGDPIGSNFLVNTDLGDNDQLSPSCAMDSAGNFIVVWEDGRSSPHCVYGQRFDQSGVPIDTNFKINDTSLTCSHPSCGMDKEGNFVVVWGEGSKTISGQLFDKSGSKIGYNFKIVEDDNSFSLNPCVIMSEDKFVVAWERDKEGGLDIYKRSFKNDGTPLSGEEKVNEIEGTANQEYPVVDMNSSGSVVVAWTDFRSPWGVYFQRLDPLGNPIGENIHIEPGYTPDVALSEDSSFVIVYRYYGEIHLQRVSPSGDTVGSPLRIDEVSGYYCYSPSVDIDFLNNAVVTWYDHRDGDNDIWAQKINKLGMKVGSNFKVNEDDGSSSQEEPSIAMTPNGKFLIAWADNRNGNYDIYAQLFGSDGTPINGNLKINESEDPSGQFNPCVAYLPDGNFIVAWEDYGSSYGVYFQIVDTTGVLVDSNCKVSQNNHWGFSPEVSVAPSGEFVITWEDYDYYSFYNIYAQRYKAQRTPDEENFKVNNDMEGVNNSQLYPSVATNGNSLIFVWQDARWQKGWDIAAKVFGLPFGIEERKSEKFLTTLFQNIPNPFGNTTFISYQLEEIEEISLNIYDISGRLVKSLVSGVGKPGIHTIIWNGKDKNGVDLPSGIYFCRLETPKKTYSIKMTLLR